MRTARAFLGVTLWGLLGACAPEVRLHAPDAYPERLSEWGVVTRSGNTLVLGDGVTPYDINTPLFSDYALKLRTLWLPEGAELEYVDDANFRAPVGTVLSKSFFYHRAGDAVQLEEHWHGNAAQLDLSQVELIETRLLVRQADGWDALPYVWRGNDAYLKITGDLFSYQAVTADGRQDQFNYVVPTRNECDACHATNHTTGATQPIGLKARHLNRGYHGADTNQLQAWADAGALGGLPPLDAVPQNANWFEPTAASLNHRARSYLDANCGHCHNAAGAADTSGLWLDYADHPADKLGVCKPPIAAGSGSGGRLFSIVPGAPDESILVFRMQTENPATRMPELGRDLAHQRGVELLSDWVASMPGACR